MVDNRRGNVTTQVFSEAGSTSIYFTNLCGARLGLGQFTKVEDDLRQAIGLTSGPNSCSLAETHTFLSEALPGQGKLREAYASAERALKQAQESKNELYLGGAWRLLGRVASALYSQRR